MTKLLLILTLLLGQQFNLHGQTDYIEKIDHVVEKIDNDTSLQFKEFDAAEIYKQAFDGGGIIKVFFNQNGINKINKEIGVSFGRLTTIVYFGNGKPIKIVDREENFIWREDQSGWDYSELNKVFQADIYIIDWETDKNKTIKQGQRNLSEGSCGIFEYEPLIKLGQELMKK